MNRLPFGPVSIESGPKVRRHHPDPHCLKSNSQCILIPVLDLDKSLTLKKSLDFLRVAKLSKHWALGKKKVRRRGGF